MSAEKSPIDIKLNPEKQKEIEELTTKMIEKFEEMPKDEQLKFLQDIQNVKEQTLRKNLSETKDNNKSAMNALYREKMNRLKMNRMNVDARIKMEQKMLKSKK